MNRKKVAFITATFVSVLSFAAIASANFGSSGTAGSSTNPNTNGVWLTNNDYYRVAKRAMTSTYGLGVSETLGDWDTIPGWDTGSVIETSCNDAAYDTCMYDYDYGDNGFNGWNQCGGTTSGSHPNQQCSVTHTRINYHNLPPAKRIACHEMGHAVGLRHTSSSSSCMKTTASGGTASTVNSHDRDHMNDNY